MPTGQDREPTGVLPVDVQAMFAEFSGTDTTDSMTAIFNALIEWLRQRPVKVNREVGERLLVFSSEQGYDRSCLHWCYRIVGENSGIEYGSADVRMTGDDVRRVGLESLGILLRLSLNHGADLPDGVFDAWAELTGHPLLTCSSCHTPFVRYSEVVAHEYAEHGVTPVD
jgi:hypothetical protein